MPLCGVDPRSRAANDFLDPERRVPIFIANVTNPAAIWRKASLCPIEITEGQRERCRTLRCCEPKLLPLAPVITAEQDSPAIRCDLRLCAPCRFFTEDFFQVFGRVHCNRPDIAGPISDFPIRH